MKKVLAWAVVLALVLSSFTMAFAGQAKTSKDFSDASEINYTEAVDVMVATGIINGYPDGTFGPAKTVKRSEMAKMIACIKNGGEDVGDQYKSACPFADSKDHWAAGYIAYCASEHIIDGRSADVFDPEAQVTGTEVAKMALTSLGYDSKIQGYTGETWAAAVLKDAKKVGLFKGLDSSFVPGDPCSREAAAQILFNMLKATEVEYKNGTSVSIGDDISVVVDSDIQPVVPDEEAFGETLEMYEDVFGGKLVPADAPDESGRPAHEWTFAGDDVGTYTDSAVLEFTANDSVTFNKALKKEDSAMWDTFFGKKAQNEVTSLYVNGMNLTPEDEGTTVDPEPGNDPLVPVGDPAEMPVVSLGDKVELFDLGNNTYRVVVTKYIPAQIANVNTKIKDEADIEAGITAKLTLDVGDNDTIPATNLMAGYDESAYVKDAIIAVAVNYEGEILDSYVPEELVTGKVSKIKNTTYTIDGTEYNPSEVFYNFDKEATDHEALAVKSEYTVYDYNGYMFAAELVAAPTPEEFYGVVTATKEKKPAPSQVPEGEWSDAELSGEKAMVKVFTPEGKTETFALVDTLELVEVGTLIKYQVNEDGDITVIEPATENSTQKPMGPTDPEATNLEPVKDGDVLYGKQLTENAKAFALIPPATTDGKAEWKVYSLDDLKAAEGICVDQYFDEKDGVTYLSVYSLEEKAKTEKELAIITNAQIIHLEDGDAYEITVLGETEPLTTKTFKTAENPFASMVAAINEDGIEFTMVTMKDGNIDAIDPAVCKGVASASEKDDNANVLFFTKETESQTQPIPGGFYKVLSKTSTSLNVGDAGYINNQACTGATVYLATLANGKYSFEESDFDSIQADATDGNVALLLKLDASSSAWDTVIYMAQN